MTTAEGLVTSDRCDVEILEVFCGAGDGPYPTCPSATFQCETCGERTSQADARATVETMCESCGDSTVEAQHQGRVDTAGDTLRELKESIIAEGLAVIAEAIKALRRLQ